MDGVLILFKKMIDQEVSFSSLFLLARVLEDLSLKAYWKSVARLPLNIRPAGLTAGPFPSQREKKMIQCQSAVDYTHGNREEVKKLTSLVNC